MKRLTVLLFVFLFTRSLSAQIYRVTTNQTDSFSIMLVKLLNCAAHNFAECRGDTLGYTEMRDYVFKLPFHFPGQSSDGTLLFSDFRKSASVTFGLCTDRECVKKATRQLIEKIRKALGNQVYVTHEFLSGPDSSFYISSLRIKNADGYFADNIEISSSIGSPKSSLSDRVIRDDVRPVYYYVHLKIDGGVPDYYHEIRPKQGMPKTDILRTIRELVVAANDDFESLRSPGINGLTAKKKDSLNIHGYPVYLNFYGGNYSAEILLPVKDNTDTYSAEQNFYKLIIEEAVGTNYVYFQSNRAYSRSNAGIVFFSKENGDHSPRIYLSLDMKDNRQYFRISITSGFYHPVKRSAGLDD